MKFQQLRERFRKGMKIPHVENPTVSEIIGLLRKSQFGDVRFVSHNGTLYAWDAGEAIHMTFYSSELFDNGYHNGENNAYITTRFFDHDDSDVEIGQELLKNHPYMRKILAGIEKEYGLTLKETNSDDIAVYYDFERQLKESAWTSPIPFNQYPTYMSIGHPGYEKFNISDVLMWLYDGKRVRYHELEHRDDIHNDYFSDRLIKNNPFGRIFHPDKVISLSSYDSTELAYFSAAYELQKKYPDYKILTQSGNHWKVFKG